MASQSALRARVATIRELLAPDISKQPCVSVYINRKVDGPLLLTAGDAPPAETPPGKVAKRRDGHVCGPRCVGVSINFAPVGGDSTAPEDAGAPSGSGRGDVQRLLESAAVGRDVVDSQSDPPRSPAPAAGAPAGLLEPPAREAVVEVARTDTRCDPVSAAVWQDVMLGLPWWLPVTEAPLGLCAVPHCEHPAMEHRGPRTGLPCRACGFRAEQHDPDGISLEVPQYARRVSPCSLYRGLCLDEVDSDKCEVQGCGCRGWRRWLPLDSRSELMVLKAQIAERDRVIAENEQKLARLQAEYEARQLALLRATSGPNDLGRNARGCPVYVEGDGT